MHGKDLCQIGDESSVIADSGTNFSLGNDVGTRIGDGDCSLVDFTKGNDAAVACDYKAELLDRLNAARRKRGKSGYVASSLVWGKIRSHRWWPGQIFDPADSSKEALRHYKEGKLLVAYFGNGTFAWNDVMQVKPFRLHFERMENQSDLETFFCAVNCALDEVFRRVEFGLSCPCLPQYVYEDIQSQIVENSGIYKKARRRDFGDEFSSVECFLPSKLVSYLKEAATFSREFINKLELVKCKAELTSFCRWKGYRELPEFADYGGLLDNNPNLTNLDGRDSYMVIANNASHVFPSKFSITEDKGEHQYKRRGRPKGILTARQKKKKKSDLMDDDELYVPYNYVKANRKAKHKVAVEAATPKNKIGTGVCKSKMTKMDKIISTSDSCITPTVGRNVSDSLSPSGLFTQLALTAIDPLNDHDYSIPLVKFFSQFRNSSFLNHHPISTEPDKSLEKKSNEMFDKVVPEYKYRTPLSEHVESYCTDIFVKESAADKCSIDSYDESASFLAEHSTILVLPNLGSETVPQLQIFSNPITQDSGSHESSERIFNMPGNQVPDNHKDEIMQTALLLRFSEQNHVPSVTDLNKIFSCYGPLHESETKIMKSNVAKVIFKRSCDAEVAFSSTGKYRTFGPSLISYRLKYQTAKPKIISLQSRKRRKKVAPVEEGNPI